VIERGLLVAVAGAIAVFTGLWLHSARLEKKAQSIAQRSPQGLSASDVKQATDLFERSRAHNPDLRPAEREAGLLIRAGRTRAAVVLLRPVVRREPDNLTAWTLVAIAAQKSDPALSRQALARARELNPLAQPAR
jgi:predicted Zn-dependent protease